VRRGKVPAFQKHNEHFLQNVGWGQLDNTKLLSSSRVSEKWEVTPQMAQSIDLQALQVSILVYRPEGRQTKVGGGGDI